MLESNPASIPAASPTRMPDSVPTSWLLTSSCVAVSSSVLVFLFFLLCIAAGVLTTSLVGRDSQEVTVTPEIIFTTAATVIILAPTPPLPTVTATPIPNPSSCAMLHQQNPEAADGEYILYFQGNSEQPFTVYCHNMTGQPAEYLTLVNSGDPYNYAMISYPEGALVTHYEKIRLNPLTLVVDRSDRTFASFPDELSGYTSVPADTLTDYPVGASDYARSEGCNQGETSAPPGQANVDLTGTEFALSESVVFVYEGGAVQEPMAEISADRKVAMLAIGGRCAHIEPAEPFRLSYAPMPTEPSSLEPQPTESPSP